ncbi:polygalacturonase-like [Aristolochia californica]|uniref:polygalacturonase-like n=1 Tax=Aristolochia californica TaxID=171875 RepID=UPI0035DB55D4
MNVQIVSGLLLLLSVITSQAVASNSDAADGFLLPNPPPPPVACPDYQFNVIDYGAVGDGLTDDTQAFRNAWEAACAFENPPTPLVPNPPSPVVYVPSCYTFLLNKIIFAGPCVSSSITFRLEGTIMGPETLDGWNCSSKSNRDWIEFQDLNGLDIVGEGTINGNGQVWWERNNKKKKTACTSPPKALVVARSSLVNISGLTLVDNPRVHMKIDSCNGVQISGLTISAPEDSPNTDGIHIESSQNLTVVDSKIGTGDDCISIGNASSYLNISGIACGPGHGISIGSLGKDGAFATVEHVRVKAVSFNGTQNGVRIKTWQGGSGYVRDVVFEEVDLHLVKNPIIIDQYYCNGHHNCKNHTSNVEVSDVSIINVHGTSSTKVAVCLACSKTVSCKQITLQDIDISWERDPERTTSYCLNAQGWVDFTVFPSVPCLDPIVSRSSSS